MATYRIEGGHRLQGEIAVHGSKNAALPILAATLLTEESVIRNCPNLLDVDAAINILECLGCTVNRSNGDIYVSSQNITSYAIPDQLMREMRSSILFLGPIAARCGKAEITYPGGCELGSRPIDMHLNSLRKMGLEIDDSKGVLSCKVNGRLKGAEINLPFPSVGATENILLAAVLADGSTTIHNAAREPEIVDLVLFLNNCGAHVHILGNGTIFIEGVDSLHPVEHSVIPDRIVASTYLCCAAATQGDITITTVRPEHLSGVLPVLEEAGCHLKVYNDAIKLSLPHRPYPVKSVRTMPYPGFPTDSQPPMMALSTIADGTSMFVENIFESRYKQVNELIRMGAQIKVEGRVAVVEGVDSLHGANVQCTDLRGGASMCVAALAAKGESIITQINHIERGYEDFDKKMTLLGANIVRE